MLKCESCGFIVIEKSNCMGFCPQCERNSLVAINIKCPICGKDLGLETTCDINSVGWCCTDCLIKIYKEI